MERNKKKICMTCSQRVLLLYCLLNPFWKETLYIDSGRLSLPEIERLKRHSISFLGGGLLTKYRKCESSNIFWRCIRKCLSGIWKTWIFLFLYFADKSTYEVYGYDSLWPSRQFMDLGWDFRVLEEGKSTYLSYEDAVRVWNTSILHRKMIPDQKYLPGGWSNRVKYVYLTGMFPTPIGLEHKTKIVDLRKKWEEMEPSMRTEIMDIFNFDYGKLLELTRSGRDCFLLAGNYAPNLIDYERMAEIYCEILAHYDHSRVVIKPHPGDIMDYSKYFPDCYILEDKFPFELCALVGLHIAKIITIDTTAACSFFTTEQVDCYKDYRDIIMREAEVRNRQ